MNRRLLYGVGIGVVVAVVVIANQRPEPTRAQERGLPEAPVARPQKALLGVASCSASVCHGGASLHQISSEATTWRALDPHARAFETLLNATSQAIAKNLWRDAVKAHEAPLCLKCHVHPEYQTAQANFRVEDGVGCESCHGAAGAWLGPHRRSSWRQANKAALGFADTKRLAGRATICARCHVGTPEANVDHDLIAAGHPALRFEFATYLANLPPHWDVARDKKANSTKGAKAADFEALAWTIGQCVSAEHALELLAHRVDPVNEKPWPEFAEFDCFSCHHDLRGTPWRVGGSTRKVGRPGSLVWSQWYLAVAMGGGLTEVAQRENPLPPFMEFRSLAMKRTDLAKIAREAAARLRGTARELPSKGAHSTEALKNGTGRSANFETWDEATQHYLSRLSFRQLLRDNPPWHDKNLADEIERLRPQVTFPERFNSPKPQRSDP